MRQSSTALGFVSRQSYNPKINKGRLPKTESYKMELQISRYLHPEISGQAIVWSGEARVGNGIPPIGGTKRQPDSGRSHDERSCTHAAGDTAETVGLKRGGVCEGEERNSRGATFPQTWKKLRGAPAVGARLLCGYGRTERGGDPAVHIGTRNRRSSDRSIGVAD